MWSVGAGADTYPRQPGVDAHPVEASLFAIPRSYKNLAGGK